MLLEGLITNAYASKPYNDPTRRGIHLWNVPSVNSIPAESLLKHLKSCHKWLYPELSDQELHDMTNGYYTLYDLVTLKAYPSGGRASQALRMHLRRR